MSSNVAEGAGRNSPKDFNNFLGCAYGSTCELETQLIISNRLKFLGTREFQGLNNLIIEYKK